MYNAYNFMFAFFLFGLYENYTSVYISSSCMANVCVCVYKRKFQEAIRNELMRQLVKEQLKLAAALDVCILTYCFMCTPARTFLD